jgi:gas vesicle protein
MVGFFCAGIFLGGIFGATAALGAASSLGAARAPQLNSRMINADVNRKFARARGRAYG